MWLKAPEPHGHPPPPRAGCWLPHSRFRRVTHSPGSAFTLTLALPAGIVPGPSRGASLPPPAMPAAALRLLCGVVMPAAMLCAEPLPRVAFPSGEYGGTERAIGPGEGMGTSWLGRGDNVGLGEHPPPGLSIQHQSCSPSQPPHLVTPLVSPTRGWGSGTAATGLGKGVGGSRTTQRATGPQRGQM